MTPAQPWHPLALLADYVEACQQWDGIDGESEGRMIAADQALFTLDSAALRAQVEADKGLREVAGRVVRKLETAHELAEVVNNQRPHGGNKLNMIDQLERIESATNMLRAALAQAGGES